MKKYLVAFFALFLLSSSLFASHFMGGEITWKCLKGGPDVGKYIFQMKVYRDCTGINFSQTSQTLDHHNYPAIGTTTPILLNFVSINDISPTGSAASGNCYSCANGDLGAVEEYVWESDPYTFAGSPPAEGWHFTWGSSARNGMITNGMSNLSWTLRAVMYPYIDVSTGLPFPASPCFDSSPEFKELAKTIICTGYPFSYSHNASDEELDDITYSWAYPLGDNFSYDPLNPLATALAFNPSPPYSVTKPIPGSPTLNAETGEISYDSDTAGFFVTCVKVEAEKCGQKVAEIFREVQVVLIACNPLSAGVPNNPPQISAPIGNQTWINTPTAAGLPSYSTTVYAGDLVTFTLQAEDLDLYSSGASQDITMEVSSGQFSDDYINPLLCDNPPCATFNNGVGLTPPFSAPSLVQGEFEWQTSCPHINISICENTASVSQTFTFVIKAFDDFCPANGISIATIRIEVVPPIPDLRCVSVKDNGDIDLTWYYLPNAPVTNEPVYVYHSSNLSGPYTILDSIAFPISTYTHVGANGNSASQYYFLSNKEGCDATAPDLNSDTLMSILMEVTPINFGTAGYLNWNPVHDPLLSSSATDYELNRKRDGGLFTNYLNTSLLSLQYDAVECNDDVEFYVEIADSSGCISKSSIGNANLLDSVTPVIPVITDVSVDGNGKSVISWIASPGADKYVIYIHGDQGVNTIDTLYDGLLTSYTYLGSSADNYFETFSVKALDSCDNTKDPSLTHNSIYLQAEIDACTYELALSWNEYINWTANVSHYSLSIQEIDINGNITLTDTSFKYLNEYVISDLKDKVSYSISITAYDGDTINSAISNVILLTSNLNKKPDYNYIEYASVNHENSFVEINCLVDNTAIIDHYDIMRSNSTDDSFIKIGEVLFEGLETIHYTDEDAKTGENSYIYKIFPVDTCGIRISAPPDTSVLYIQDTSFAQTIFLQTDVNLNYDDGFNNIESTSPYDDGWVGLDISKQYTNTISFNEYDKWLGEVKEYRLYRAISSETFNNVAIHTWNMTEGFNDTLRYIDVVTQYGYSNGRFCYYIKAFEGDSTPYTAVIEGSLSNISCISQTPKIFIPSVFTPNGDEHNEVFIPITNYVSEKGYSFKIFNRSGGVIFETNDPKKGWDGNFNGNRVQQGNYVYHLQYINGVGNIIDKTNILSLVR